VEHQRFARDIGFTYEIIINMEVDKNNTRIPPLILQPIVENAVKYCSIKENEQSMIWVEVNHDKGNIIISVENTLSDQKRNQSGFGEGLKIVRERIEIYNKTLNSKISLLENTIFKNSSNGYRTMLIIEI
jgi:LytS/YehU family sensor histidine kinase